jgi:hypothetical protein
LKQTLSLAFLSLWLSGLNRTHTVTLELDILAIQIGVNLGSRKIQVTQRLTARGFEIQRRVKMARGVRIRTPGNGGDRWGLRSSYLKTQWPKVADGADTASTRSPEEEEPERQWRRRGQLWGTRW